MPKESKDQISTKERLIEAAAEIFNSTGIDATNTNKIAKAAGFAPQTFYRHFEDKIDIFIAVYRRWEATEVTALLSAVRETTGTKDIVAKKIATIVLDHHREWAIFRRSLRTLTATSTRVRENRKIARTTQAKQMNHLPFPKAMAVLFMIEALCDAYGDRLTDDFGISKEEWIEEIKIISGPAISPS